MTSGTPRKRSSVAPHRPRRLAAAAPAPALLPALLPARLPALLLVLLLTVTACSGGDDSAAGDDSSPSPTSGGTGPSPSPGEETADTATEGDAEGRLTGNGFAFTLPDGWEESSPPAEQPLIGAVAADPDPGPGRFGDNLNVVVNPEAPRLAPPRLEKQLISESREITDTLSVQGRTEIAGQPAVHVTGTAPATEDPSIPLVFEQYATYSDQVLYIITFTHARSTPQDDKSEDVESVLGSWSWSEGDGA